MSVTSVPNLSEPPPGAAQLYFSAGIPGFPRARVFFVQPWGTGPTPFSVLESQDVSGLCFVTVNPAVFFPSYEPEFGDEIYQAIDANGREDVELMVILTLHARPQDATANLLGPVVVNARTGQAVQAVLSGSGFDPQTPIATSAKPAAS